MEHPSADADFERILRSVDTGRLTQALEQNLNAPRAGCRADAPLRATPDAIVKVEAIDVGMGCLMGRQEYSIAVRWRTTATGSTRTFNWTTTRCTIKSARDVGEWFAHPDEARTELEQALAAIGRRMSAQLLGDAAMPAECALEVGVVAPADAR